MTVPASRSAACYLRICPVCRLLTGPTRSGMYSSSSATFPSMKKKPNSVTRFGAIQSGRSSTKPFHYAWVRSWYGCACPGGAYVVFKDVAGDEGLVHARVFVRFQVLQGVFRHALMLCAFCGRHELAISLGIERVRRRARTFAGRHGGGMSDRRWERHGC
jgi:hypothetical protein